jgi:DNA polymerase-3 subunit delta
MRLRPEQLATQLQKQLLPVYCISGDEPLLIQEACDTVRSACREAGCNEREVMQVEAKFDWGQLHAVSAEMSLFAERKLIELRIPSGKPGTEGSKALTGYLENPSPDNILLVIAGKIDKQSTNSKWYKALDSAGAVVQVWPVKAHELPRWMQQRIQAAGLQIGRDALQLLCDRVEGNLLAAAQEIEKLKLLRPSGEISSDDVSSSVADNARYNLFTLVDCAVQGDAAGALKMLNGLRAEGTEAPVVLWALARELRLLYQCQSDVERGQNLQQVFKALRVWDTRKSIVSAGLQRHSLDDLAELLHQANQVDLSIKGLASEKPWDLLSGLVLGLAQGN